MYIASFKDWLWNKGKCCRSDLVAKIGGFRISENIFWERYSNSVVQLTNILRKIFEKCRILEIYFEKDIWRVSYNWNIFWERYCQTWFQTSVWVYLPEELSESWKLVVGRTIRNTFLKHEIQNVRNTKYNVSQTQNINIWNTKYNVSQIWNVNCLKYKIPCISRKK